MKFIPLTIIQLYWATFPKHKRRNCLFEESCSKYVYRIISEKGVISGLFALKTRIHQCRPGYTVFKNEQNNTFELGLKDGRIIRDAKISPRLLPPYNYNYIAINSMTVGTEKR